MFSSKKKLFNSLVMMLAFIICINSFGVMSRADSKRTVYVNGAELVADPGAIDSDGVTYFPIEELCNALGISTQLVATDTYKLTYEKLNKEMIITKGNKTIIINGVPHTVPFNVMGIYTVETLNPENEKTEKVNVYVVALKYIVEQFGGEVSFSAELNRIYITKNKPIEFKDKIFEEEIRSLIKKPEGEIYKFDIQDITSLDLSGKGITSVDELKYFENLTYLNLKNNKISDLSVLENLKKLTSLYVSGNDPSLDVYTPIAMFYENIKQMDIKFEVKLDSNLEAAIRAAIKKQSGKIEPKDLRGLTEFNAPNKKILSIEGLNYMVNLKKLDLSNNSILDIKPLKNLTKIESLKLNNNGISDISILSKFQKMTVLEVENNKIKDISSLKELKKLNVLKISGNLIGDASPITGLTNLKELYIDNNKLTDTYGIENLTFLTTLYLKDVDPEDSTKLTTSIPEEKLMLFQKIFKRLENTDLDETDFGLTTPIATPAKETETPTIVTATPTMGTVISTDAFFRYTINKSTYTVNGVEYKMDEGVWPVIKNSRTGIPVRYITQHIDGATIGWNEKERKVSIQLGTKSIDLYVDINYAVVDGKMVKLDVAPFIFNGRTMVPLRFVSESLGLETIWNAEKQEITLIYELNK